MYVIEKIPYACITKALALYNYVCLEPPLTIKMQLCVAHAPLRVDANLIWLFNRRTIKFN